MLAYILFDGAYILIDPMLDSLNTSKTRLKLLIEFFVSASNQGHLHGLVEDFLESTNAIRKRIESIL